VIIHNLHFKGVTIPPFETDTPSLIDPDTVLSLTAPFEFLQAVCRWNTQVIQRNGPIQHPQLAQGNLLNVMRQLPGTPTEEYPLSFFALEGPDHNGDYISQCVKRQALY
jgi:hypothetical protein